MMTMVRPAALSAILLLFHCGCGRDSAPPSRPAESDERPPSRVAAPTKAEPRAEAESPAPAKKPAEQRKPVAQRTPPPTVPVYGKWETRVPVDPGKLNPFDAEQVSVVGVFEHSSGTVHRVSGFWSRDYKYDFVEEPRSERFAPVGEPGFLVRFAPPTVGEYAYHFTATVGDDTKELPGGTLRAVPAETTGPLRKGGSDRYLVDSAGNPVFLIGQNIGWSRRKAPYDDLRQYFTDLADTGQNFLRLWHCTWCVGFEHDKMEQYDLARGWQFDRLVELAEERGLYIMYCFENFHDIKTKQSPYWLGEDGQSGAIRTREEYFTSPDARRAFRNRLRYAIARWGHSNAIGMWEFFNEMEYTVLGPLELDSSVRDRYFRPWLTEMAAQVRKWDAYRHLLTNSLAVDRIWDGMYRMDWMDLVQHHAYLNAWDTDGAGKALRCLSYIVEYNKPYLLGEFGGAEAGVYGQTKNIVNETDTLGLHLHNAIWASALSGSCGTALMWWWDEYIRPRKLYHHYAALAAFLRGTPWLDPRLRVDDLSTNSARVLVVRGADWALLWAQNPSYTWENAATAGDLEPIPPFRTSLTGMTAGTYRAEWWDTLKGSVTRTLKVECAGDLPIDVPELKTDLALKLRRE